MIQETGERELARLPSFRRGGYQPPAVSPVLRRGRRPRRPVCWTRVRIHGRPMVVPARKCVSPRRGGYQPPAYLRLCPTNGRVIPAPTMQTHVPVGAIHESPACPPFALARQTGRRGRRPLRCNPRLPVGEGLAPPAGLRPRPTTGRGRAPPLRCKPASPRRGGYQPPAASPAPTKKPPSAAQSEKQPPPGLLFVYRRAISVSARARARTKSAPVKVCRPVLVVQGMFSFMMSSSRFYLQARLPRLQAR